MDRDDEPRFRPLYINLEDLSGEGWGDVGPLISPSSITAGWQEPRYGEPTYRFECR